jgi:hypothetical protein
MTKNRTPNIHEKTSVSATPKETGMSKSKGESMVLSFNHRIIPYNSQKPTTQAFKRYWLCIHRERQNIWPQNCIFLFAAMILLAQHVQENVYQTEI